MATFGILVGGGPAPGINGVIGAATLTALEAGHRVVGILDGFEHLMAGLPEAELRSHTRELGREEVATIHQRGGSILHTSRANPTKDPVHLERCVASLDALGIDHLVTIGGDDTAFSSKRVSDTAQGRIACVHVPKTIDNDLPLPAGVPTFGYETARDVATGVVENLMEDCRTTGRWFFVIMMGRKAGHLALGAGLSAGAAVTLIPEEFATGDKIRLEDVARVLEGAILKRLARGQRDGVAVIAEGVSEFLDADDLAELKDAPRDEHGHIRLAEVPLGKVLANRVKADLAARGVAIAIGTKDVGYELRCASPCAFDREYTRDLGAGAVGLLLSGRSGALVTRREGQIEAIAFEDLIDAETGRTKVRMVETGSDFYAHALALQDRIRAADLSDAGRLEALAAASHQSADETKARFAPVA